MGDFQTPAGLVAAVLERLGRNDGRWTRALEPTCGEGRFLAGLLASADAPREMIGVEIQADHLAKARKAASGAPVGVRIELIEGNVFELDLAGLKWRESGPLLVLGNPPWVTNSALGALGSENRPARVNAKGVRGIDAKTGASNFDIGEAVWLKLLKELAPEKPTIALLCKTSVSRNVLEYVAKNALPVSSAWVAKIDTRAWFGASVEACLLCVTLGGNSTLERISVFEGLDALKPCAAMGFARGKAVADLDAYAAFAFADGQCGLVWRQGVKHDAAEVMELALDGAGIPRNKQGDVVDVEPEHLFPLLKGSDLARPRLVETGRRVLLTQRTVGEDTRPLEHHAPRLWAYLQAHKEAFSRRKSSIYRGRPPFSMFGVGPYCFSGYKVAVSGLHKGAVFHAVGPGAGLSPVLMDDTGYFLPCRSVEQAAFVARLLNGPAARGLLRALTFSGAKRPVTKRILQRVDLRALLDASSDTSALLAGAEADIMRLAGRRAVWPPRPEELLEPLSSQGDIHAWPSPPSTTSAGR